MQEKNRAAVSTAGNGDNAYTTALDRWCRYIPLRWEESCKTIFDKFLKVTPKACTECTFIHFQLIAILSTLRYHWCGESIFDYEYLNSNSKPKSKRLFHCVRNLCRTDLYETIEKTVSLLCLCKNKWKPLFSRQPAQARECRMAQYAVTDPNHIKIWLLWD